MDFGYIGKVLSPVKTNEMGYIKSSFQNVKVRPKPKTDKTAGPADKFCEIFPLLLTVVKSKGKIAQNFVAYSEYGPSHFLAQNFGKSWHQ